MWRYGFQNPVNYDDSALFCGGKFFSFTNEQHQKRDIASTDFFDLDADIQCNSMDEWQKL